ncbi:L-lysine 6-monooxygenase (NADPH-requiring)-domain-containing protein [Schizophyllum commune]
MRLLGITSDGVFELKEQPKRVVAGYGPANVVIGGALAERWEKDKTASQPSSTKEVLLVEKVDKFWWHFGMLLADARMQMSYLKDLTTLRNPSSPITFLSYLHAHGRLLSFINRGCTLPSRKEFADYLGWVVQYVQDRGVDVKFGHEVIGLEEEPDGLIDVRVRAIAMGEMIVLKAKNAAISPGGSPRLPDCVKPVSTTRTSTRARRTRPTSTRPCGKLKEQGERPLTNGIIGAADRLLGDRLFCLPEFNKLSYGNISMIVFSRLPIGTNGLTKKQAREKQRLLLPLSFYVVNKDPEPTVLKLICAGPEERVVETEGRAREVFE